jgi:DNA-directed RNA polymerase subunit N (RpoN/RPB10)
MIIPIRCFTCGEVVADKWIAYVTEVQNRKNAVEKELDPTKNILDLQYIDITKQKGEKSIEGEILDEMNLHKYCCRRMMLSNVNIISYLS